MKAHDLALLLSFLAADKAKLLDMMVDRIGSELGYHPETFMSDFLPQVTTSVHELFKPAIEALEGDEQAYWRDVSEAPPVSRYETLLGLYTEGHFECFEAEFVSSEYEITGESNG